MVKRFTWIWTTVVLSVFTVNLHAQDWKSIITGIASAVGDKVTGNNSLEGTWKYAGPDCKFSSDNFLATAGGELAAEEGRGTDGRHSRKDRFQGWSHLCI